MGNPQSQVPKVGKMRKYRDFKRVWSNYCIYCGVRLCNSHRLDNGGQCGDEATWDHVVPHQNGKSVIGRDKVVACHDCNGDRGDKTIPGWHSSITQRLEAGTVRKTYIEKAKRVVGISK